MQIKLILFTSRIFLSLLEDLIDMDAAMMAFNCCKIRPGWFFIYFNFMLNSSMHPPNITVPFKESLFTKSYLNEWGNPEIAQLNDIFQISNKIQNELPHECGPLCLISLKSLFFQARLSFKQQLQWRNDFTNQWLAVLFRRRDYSTILCIAVSPIHK